MAHECFGPVSIVVSYDSEEELLLAADLFDGQLAAAIHGEVSDAVAAQLVSRLRGRVGRLVWNAWPTGVVVSWATHHGGPYPATTNSMTSVGTSAVDRFLRPLCYQGFPDSLLPPALRSDNPWSLPRAVDAGQNSTERK